MALVLCSSLHCIAGRFVVCALQVGCGRLPLDADFPLVFALIVTLSVGVTVFRDRRSGWKLRRGLALLTTVVAVLAPVAQHRFLAAERFTNETLGMEALAGGTATEHRGVVRELWDQDGFQMSAHEDPVRVLCARESRAVKRQLDAEGDTVLTQWYWVTTLSRNRAVSAAIVELGHARWEIENQGFNEITNRWHADHVYRHEQRAMLHFQLLAMIAYNLFGVFWFRQLPKSFRDRHSLLHLARVLASELFQEPTASARSP